MQIPGIGLVGTRAEVWIGDNPSGRFHDHPTEDAKLRFALLFNNYFVHSSVMMRKAALDEVGSYTTDRSRQPPEDYEIWSRIARRFSVANLPERLTIYREVPASMSRASAQPFLEKLVVISSENLAYATGAAAPQQVHIDIAALVHSAEVRALKRPDLDRMSSVIDHAGYGIAGGRPGPELTRKIALAKANIRHRFMLRQPAYGWMWRTARTVRGRLRRIIAAAR